ncbi:MAG: glycosyltransferase family 39 protein [Bdellovibrionota bacterium]
MATKVKATSHSDHVEIGAAVKSWKVFLLFLFIGFSIYGISLGNEFVMDDEEQIALNEIIHSLENIPKFFTGSTMNEGGTGEMGGIYYKPIMTLAYSLFWQASGTDPWSYHLFQILVHITNAFLFYLLLRNWFQFYPALLTAIVFLVHTLNTESVVYIADLQDVLYPLFGLSALLLFVRGGDRIPWRRLLGIGALLLMSLLSKESGALFIFMLIMAAVILKPRTFLPIMATVTVSLGIYLWMRLGLAGLTSADHGITQIGRASFMIRLQTAPAVMASYLWKFIFPWNLTTTQDWIVTQLTFEDFWLPLFALAAILISASYFAIKKPHRVFIFFLVWCIAGFGFHSHIIVPLDGTTADRWFYFSMLGLLGLLLQTAHTIIKDRPWPKGLSYLIIVFIIGLSARSVARTLNWKDGYTLYAHDVEVFPESYDIQNNYGVELFRHGKYSEALERFKKSTQLAPHWTINWNNLGAAYQRLGNIPAAEDAYKHSIDNGRYYLATENYVGILIQQRKYQQAEEYLREKGLVVFPENRKLQDWFMELKNRQH